MTARTSAADLVPIIDRIYAHHSAGCCWHVVLDDGNLDEVTIDHCAAHACEEYATGGCESGAPCVDLARLWRQGRYSRTQLRKAIAISKSRRRPAPVDMSRGPLVGEVVPVMARASAVETVVAELERENARLRAEVLAVEAERDAVRDASVDCVSAELRVVLAAVEAAANDRRRVVMLGPGLGLAAVLSDLRALIAARLASWEGGS